MNDNAKEYATIDEFIVMLQKVAEEGHGGFMVVCNDEYFLARKDKVPSINYTRQEVDIGGYI